MPELVESERRLATFREGVPIVLADGQTWHFPRPTIELFPTFDEEGRVADFDGRPSFGPDYDDKLDAFVQAEKGAAELKALMVLAVDLLGRNYRLCPGDFVRLLRYRKGDEANRAMWQAIADTAQGNGPKACPVGDASTSSPTGSAAR
jgi:hypothetical protein